MNQPLIARTSPVGVDSQKNRAGSPQIFVGRSNNNVNWLPAVFKLCKWFCICDSVSLCGSLDVTACRRKNQRAGSRSSATIHDMVLPADSLATKVPLGSWIFRPNDSKSWGLVSSSTFSRAALGAAGSFDPGVAWPSFFDCASLFCVLLLLLLDFDAADAPGSTEWQQISQEI